MSQSVVKYVIIIFALFVSSKLDAREDSWPQFIPADLPMYTNGTPRLHYNLVPQYNLSEDNLKGPVDSCAVYRMTINSEWGEQSIVKGYLWRETSYTPEGYRKQRKEYYLYEGRRNQSHLEFIENYTGNPTIQTIKVYTNPEHSDNYDIYEISVIDNYHKNVLLTRASGEQSMWKSIIDPSNGLFKLEYYNRKNSDPEITYTNFLGPVYSHKDSYWRQTLKNLFNEREIMHTNTPVYAFNDGLFLTPPYSVGEYNLYENNDTHKIVRISPIQATIDEGVASVKEGPFDKETAYCTIELEYNDNGDYSKISFIQHKLVKTKQPNGSISYSWEDKTKWYVTWEYEYDSHGNWTLLKYYRNYIDSFYGLSESSAYYSREIFYADLPQEINSHSTDLSMEDVLADPKILTDGVDYKIESFEQPKLIATTEDGKYVCAIPSDEELIIRIYDKNKSKWISLIPSDWDCDYCWFKDYRLIGNNLYLILSTHANGVGGTCCTYDVFKYNLKTNTFEEILGCACECEFVGNTIKASILEIISGDNWENHKSKNRVEWIEMN